ncbi:MAG: hypothetical protein AAF682_21650 [Planctomycetota bacterium]
MIRGLSQRLVPALLAAIALALPAAADEQVHALVERLQPALEPGAAAPTLSVGPDAIPALALLLDEGWIAAEWRSDGGPGVRLTTGLDEALLAALAAQPLVELRAFLGARAAAAPPPSEDQRRTALRVLARAGNAADVELLIELAAPPAEETGVPATRRRLLEQALGEVVARDPDAAWRVRERFARVDGSLLSSLVRGVAQAEADVALRALADLLTRRQTADPLLLAELGKVAERVSPPADELVLAAVRACLDSPPCAVLAAQALGALEDCDSAAVLIELLEVEDPNVAAAAGGALERIFGRGPRGARAWREWHAAELRWWNKESVVCFRELRSTDAAEAASAIRRVAGHRIYRHELATALAHCLTRREPDLVRLACGALADVGSAAAVPALIEALSHVDPEISAAAHAALQRITGRDLPPDPEAWSRATA